MFLPALGHTRSSLQPDHLLQTPDTFVRVALPGISGGAAIVHTAPALGAAFTQYTVELQPGGLIAPSSRQRFVFVVEGSVYLSEDAVTHALTQDSYAYLPSSSRKTIAADSASRLVVIEKPYKLLADTQEPQVLVGDEFAVPPQPLMGDASLQVRSLLPDDPSFDFAVNTMTYDPGASLSMVEIHVMEHGLLMLEGGGIYRLGDRWYPVIKGDFIWMAPYCPQWFGALGKTPAKYLIYKDSNRHPLEQP
jgi:(S)-ureidoglycine aminohydrolase